MKRCIFLFLLIFLAISLFSAEIFIVKSNQSPVSYNLWIEKDDKITFSVNGKWTMWDKWSPVDCKGHMTFELVGSYYLGTLLGRIEGGTDFPITDGLVFTAPKSGRLVMYPNRGKYAGLNTSGEMIVTVTGGKIVTAIEAEKLSGWDLSILDTARNTNYLTDKEKDVILLLNKARSNPRLFALQYLENLKNSGKYALECYNEMIAAKTLPVLQPSKALSMAAKEHAKTMGEKGLTGHNGPDGSSPSDRVVRYGIFTGKYLGPWENCSYGFNDPLEIILQLLIDDGVESRGHRKNILSPDIRYAGTSIMPHKSYMFNCVQDFADSIEDKKGI
jgi:uncharacterized protein YkwD